ATLLHTEPVANSSIDDSPAKLVLTFNERVEPVFNSIRIVDGQGRLVKAGDARLVGEKDTVELDLGPLSDGPYAVLWRINSADGHQVQGRFGFGVRSQPPNENSLPNLVGSERSDFWNYYVLILKWLALTSLVIWLGGVAFIQLVLRPSVSANPS